MRNVSLYIDMAFCFILLPLMMFMFPVERWWGTYPLFFGSFVAWLYITYFAYKYLIVPHLFQRGRPQAVAVVAIIVSVVITFMFSSYHITSPYYHLRQQCANGHNIPIWGMRPNQQAVWLHYIVVVFFCFAVGMITEAYKQRMAREEMEYERNKAELALYKAQINPHFLFNTLNTIYGLLITHSDKTVSTLERFINLTKYTYNNASREYITIREEVEYISQYIDLQRLRLNDMAEVIFTHHIEHPDIPLPPMLLVTFVENAFKYGISSQSPCYIHIRFTQQGRHLCFEVDNSIVAHHNAHSKGTGIDNCRRRLSLLYPNHHHLECRPDDNGNFHVKLELTATTSLHDIPTTTSHNDKMYSH